MKKWYILFQKLKFDLEIKKSGWSWVWGFTTRLPDCLNLPNLPHLRRPHSNSQQWAGTFICPEKPFSQKSGKSSIFFAHVIQNHRLLERTFVKNSTLSTWKSNYRNQLFYAPRKLLNFSSCMKSSLKAEEEWIRRLSRFEPLEHFDAPVDRS